MFVFQECCAATASSLSQDKNIGRLHFQFAICLIKRDIAEFVGKDQPPEIVKTVEMPVRWYAEGVREVYRPWTRDNFWVNSIKCI